MGATGKWLLILGIIALLSAIAFGFSIAAYGVKDGNYGITMFGKNLMEGVNLGGSSMVNAEILFREGQTNVKYDFERSKDYSGSFDAEDLSDIKLELASCHADIKCSDTDKVNITYTTGSTPTNFVAELNDGILTISEKMQIGLFSFGSGVHSDLVLEVPETVYNSVNVVLASGKVLSDKIISDKFNANVASGSVEMGMYAEDMDINVASGKIIFTNCTDKEVDDIKLNAASGSIEMNGFAAEDTKISIASGSVLLNGISGKVVGELASGKLILNYSKWNDDLDIKLLSGKCDATLPAGSGANVSLQRLSGNMSIDLDGNTTKLTGNTNDVTLGGSNVHKVNGDIASGSINIHN